MVGLIEPDSGDVVVDGQNLSELDVGELNALRRDIGYVFQFAALFDSMSIADNVAMGLRRIPPTTLRWGSVAYRGCTMRRSCHACMSV